MATSWFSSTVQWPIKLNLVLCINILYIQYTYLPRIYLASKQNAWQRKMPKVTEQNTSLPGLAARARSAFPYRTGQALYTLFGIIPPCCSAGNIYLWPAPTTARQTIFNLNNFARKSWTPLFGFSASPFPLHSLSQSLTLACLPCKLSCRSGWIVE